MFAARLRAYAPGGAALGLLPDPLSWQASIVHGDLGALTVTYSTLSAGGPLIERALADGPDGGLEVAVEVWEGPDPDDWVEPRGCRFVRVAEGADEADDMEVYSITFRAWGWLLTQAPLIAGTFTDGRRVFTAPKAGTLMATVLAENLADGGVPVTVVGGGTTDAGGASWPALPDQGFDYGVDYLGILRGLQEAGAIDWATQARGLYMYLPDSASLSPDLSATVLLRLGLDIGQAPADKTIEGLLYGVAVQSQHGGTVVVDEPTAPTPWGKWRRRLSIGQVDDVTAATAMGQAELERSGRAREQYTRDLVLHDAAPIPLVDYWPGAWITAPTSVAAESVRVQQVTLTFGSDGYGGNVVLNDRLIEGDIRRSRTLATLAGGQVGAGGAPAPIVTDPEASRIPSTPTGLTRSAALTFTGPTPRGVVTASWDAVTTATDTGTLAISGYELQWQVGAGAWQTIFTPELSAQITDLTPGDSITVRVRAVGARTILPSAYATAAAIAVPGDVTAPSVPTGLSITSALRIASVTWAGTLTAAIPADFARIEIAMGTTTTPTTVYGVLTRAGTLQVTGASLGIAIGATVYARARSVDSTGNPSAYGTAVSVTMAGVAGPDLAANSVTANTIAAGALDAFLITGATVRSSATNPRTEMNSSGFFAYNGSGVETISLLGSSATITGATIRTASGTTRLEMTTAGMIAYTSGVAVAEFLPGGLFLRAGGELVVEYADSSPALLVGDLGSNKYGIEMYDTSGTDVFTLSTNETTGDVFLTMDGLTNWTVSATTAILQHSTFQVTGGGFSGDDLSHFTLSPTRGKLNWRNNALTVENYIEVDATAVRLETTAGGASDTRVTLSGDISFLTGGTRRLVVTSAGSVGLDNLITSSTASHTVALASPSGSFYPLRRITSSLKYKQDVEPHAVDLAALLTLEPRSWRDKAEVVEDPDTTRRHVGLIAEEVHAAGLVEFVQYDTGGGPDGFNYDRFAAVALLAAVKDLNSRLEALEAP